MIGNQIHYFIMKYRILNRMPNQIHYFIMKYRILNRMPKLNNCVCPVNNINPMNPQ